MFVPFLACLDQVPRDLEGEARKRAGALPSATYSSREQRCAG